MTLFYNFLKDKMR